MNFARKPDHKNLENLEYEKSGHTGFETPTGSQYKVDAHKDLTTGIHGVGSGIIAALDTDQKIPTVNLGGPGADNTKYLRGDQTWQTPAGTGAPPSYMQEALIECYPFGGAPTTLTPTNHAANVARVFPFEVDRPITVSRIIIRTNAALANCLILGIFDSAGNRIWTSGVLSTLATRWVIISSGLPITLPVGTYYFATTNNNVTSTTAAYTVTPALGGADIPRWGTVPATSGAMPTSINPAAITPKVGGWMCYILLSNVIT